MADCRRSPRCNPHFLWPLIALLPVALASAAAAAAEEPELLTDRPDFTETSVVVPRGRLQIEGGFTFQHGKSGGRAWNSPETLLRLGIGRRWEARLEVPDYARARSTERRTGFGDLVLGAKYQLRPAAAAVTLALIPKLSLPTGDRDFTSHCVDPALALAWATDVSKTRSLAGLLGLSWPTEEGDRNFTLTTTLSYGIALDDRSDLFLEAFADFPERGPNLPGVHAGIAYRLRPNLQLDLHGGAGLSGSGPEYFIGAGFGVRY